jgi:hypothetical protein
MQPTPESRSSMRAKVRALAKFQMRRLIGQRTHIHHGELAARQDWHSSERTKPTSLDPLQETESHIPPGLPGYRLSPGHSGWDPIESVMEISYLIGRFFRDLFTGRWILRN